MSLRALDRLNDDEPNLGYKPPHEHHASGRQRRFLGTSGNARFAGSSGSPRLAGSGGGSTRFDCVSSAGGLDRFSGSDGRVGDRLAAGDGAGAGGANGGASSI